MNLTLLQGGGSAISRYLSAKKRLFVAKVSFSSAVNFAPNPALHQDLPATIIYSTTPTASNVGLANTLTISVSLPYELALTYGSVGIYDDSGICLAIGSLAASLTKAANTHSTVTLTLTAANLTQSMTYDQATVVLSRARPDYTDILRQLQGYAASTPNFGSLVANETGQTLLELMAGVGDFSAYMADSAYRESFPDTAFADTSIYAIQTLLGTRLARKNPASITVRLTRTSTAGSLTVPAYSQFAAGGTSFFTRDIVTFPSGAASVDTVLYQGEVKTVTLNGLGTDYQFYASPEDAFTISDSDVTAYVNGVPVPVVTDAIWNYAASPAVQDYTSKDGNLLLLFGNALFGTMPAITDTVTLMYVVTQGGVVNSTVGAGVMVSSSVPGLSGATLATATGGGDQTPASTYRRFGGHLFGGQRGMVTQDQFVARALSYPGVVDVKVLGQRDLAPMSKEWFNTCKVVLLTSSPWSAGDVANFTTWYQKAGLYSMRYVVVAGLGTDEPKKRMVDVALKVMCVNDTNLPTIKQAILAALTDYFTLRQGSLSRDMYVSDLVSICRDCAGAQLDYVSVLSPTGDTYCDLQTVSGITTADDPVGSLPTGEYKYFVTAIDADGETYPAATYHTLTSGGGVTLAWSKVPGALSYNVYGRDADAKFLANTTDLSFTDNGTLSPMLDSPPSINTSGVHYISPNSITVDVGYTRKRTLRG